MKNIKKRLLMPLGMVATIGTVSVPHYSTINQNTNGTYWYNNLKSDKFEIRNQATRQISNTNGNEIEIPIDNGYELKLLLNPGTQATHENVIKQFNSDFITKINEIKLKYKSYEISEIMPVAWFTFENEEQRKNFTNTISDWSEIFKVIIYKNEEITQSALIIHDFERNNYGTELKPTLPKNKYIYASYFIDYNLESFKHTMNKNIDIVNAKYYLDNQWPNKIGILEAYAYPFDNHYSNLFTKGIEVNDINGTLKNDFKGHSTLVAMISGSNHGVDRNSKVYLSSFNTDAEWTKALEKMVKDGVKIINHSYATNYRSKTAYADYNENTLYLDYLSRKYNIINIMGAGNKGKDMYHIITGRTHALNSIVVGALSNSANNKNLGSNIIADYSNYRLPKGHENLAKPLVVAPGYFYNPGNGANKFEPGTSYAAPIVTGLVSNFLKYKPDIAHSEFVVPIVKTVLSASAVTPKFYGLKRKSSGYLEKYGSGTVDFVAMLRAGDNYKTIKVPVTSKQTDVFTSEIINLNSQQTLKIAASWMFNAGLLKNSEHRPWEKNWWNIFTSWFSPSSREAGNEWDYTHIDKDHLNLNGVQKRSNNQWFNDYQLTLEKYYPDGTWRNVKSINESFTNDELIEYKANEKGKYRYKITKKTAINFANSADDLIAVTHVVRDENN